MPTFDAEITPIFSNPWQVTPISFERFAELDEALPGCRENLSNGGAVIYAARTVYYRAPDGSCVSVEFDRRERPR